MSNYPNKIDTDTELPIVIDNVTEVTADIINAIREAVIAIEVALGIDPQGSSNNLSDRINNALNADGTIKGSALSSAGLISLPVTNTHIGSSAAIEESKLNLDYTTQELQDQISSNDIDISELQSRLQSLLNRYNLHITGSGDRHNSSHIDHSLTDGYGIGYGTSVKTALDYTYGEIETHKAATTGYEHNASVIKYVPGEVLPGEVSLITSTNVQGAIDEIDAGISEQLRIHNDQVHDNGITADGYYGFGGQIGVNDASLNLTRFKPNSGIQINKVGLVNASTVKSKGFVGSDFSSSSNAINITAKIGSSSRTLNVTGLDGAAYPSGTGRVTLQGIVDYLNTQFANTAASAHFPVSAFASKDGELVLQHNIADDNCTITISDPGANSAVDALGFTDIIDIEVPRFELYSMHIDGTRYTELKTLLSGDSSQGILGSTVDLGSDIASAEVTANMLLHVYDHSDSTANGTYRIDGYSGTQVTLNENMAVGTFSFVIYEDTCSTLGLSGNRHALDFYIDSNRDIHTYDRAEIVFGGVEGVRIVELSDQFVSMSGYFTMVTSGSNRQMYFTDSDGYVGVPSEFEPGFIGYKNVYAPNNVGYATVLVYDIVPVNGTDVITVSDPEFSDDKILLGANHYNGLTTIELPMSRINIGLSSERSIGSEFKRKILERETNAFHFSGIIRGFDIVSWTTSRIYLRGGLAFISGVPVEEKSQGVDVVNYATTDGVWNLVLKKDGSVEIYKDTSGTAQSFSVAQILKQKDMILLYQLTISGGDLTAISDARFFVNDIENKLPITVDDRDLGAGTFRSLDAAVLYSKNAPNDTKPEIIIYSDLTEVDLTIDSNSTIVCYGDITLSGTLTISSGAVFKIHGTLSCSADISIQSGASLEIIGGGSITGAITVSSDSQIIFGDDTTVTTISISGYNIAFKGNEKLPKLTFDGSGSGISGDFYNVNISELDLVMTFSTNPILAIGAGERIRIDNCRFSQSVALTTSYITSTARAGISLTGTVDLIEIVDGYFENLGAGIIGTGAVSNLYLSDSYFKNIGNGVRFIGVTKSSISNCTMEGIHANGIYIDGVSLTAAGVLVSNCIFDGNFDPSSTPYGIYIRAGNGFSISNCIFNGFDTSYILYLTTIAFYSNVSECIFSDNTTSNFAVFIGKSCVFSSNSFKNHTGQVLSSTGGGIVAYGNKFNVSASASSNSIIDGYNGIFNDNYIDITSSTGKCQFYNCDVVGNLWIKSPRVLFDGSSGTPSAISGNVFYTIGGSFNEAIQLNIGEITFSNNTIDGTSTFGVSPTVLRVTGTGSGNAIISENYIYSSSSTRAVSLEASSGERVSFTGNHVSSGSMYGVYVDQGNATITDNVIFGAVGGGGADVYVTSGKQNVFVTNNVADGSGGLSDRIAHADASPTNCYLGMNKNALERRSYSVFAGLPDSNWSITDDGVISSTIGASLRIPLNNLPVGAKLESVTAYVANVGSLGDATVQIFERTTSGIAASILSSPSDVPAGVYGALTVSPTSTTYIRNGVEYFIKVVMVTASAVTVGQTSANIRI